MNILIPGGAGFVGLNIVSYWFKKYPKYTFHLVDNKSLDELPFLAPYLESGRAYYHELDLRNKKETRELFETIQPDIVINAIEAARKKDFLEIHVFTTENLLEAAKAVAVKQFIHLSCGAIYGYNPQTAGKTEGHRLVNELDALLPSSPQNASKAAADLLVWSYSQRYGVPITTLRVASLFGPFQSIDRFIPLMITHALQNQSFPISSSGADIRDILHIEDFVDALDVIVNSTSAIGEIYNISAGVRVKNKEIADIIITLLDRSSSLMFVSDDVKPEFAGLDPTKFINSFNWEAKRTPEIHESLSETVQWYKDNSDWWKTDDHV
ncbi:NAD-dependent epimerase/dehydratase family protein [candidate division WWE3 bacterium]|uniref:NAD-dependent epimerase/dehydratase family protein n=1 Tax=candidate division WWE3 bacterium TaxID=2053526 RepID=A0A955LHI7_UNCKA|nr:NAD-dependent epimerase/dehydratase family protein [candidate division WWE3 bacterium]